MKYDLKNNKYFRWGLTAFLTIAVTVDLGFDNLIFVHKADDFRFLHVDQRSYHG